MENAESALPTVCAFRLSHSLVQQYLGKQSLGTASRGRKENDARGSPKEPLRECGKVRPKGTLIKISRGSPTYVSNELLFEAQRVCLQAIAWASVSDKAGLSRRCCKSCHKVREVPQVVGFIVPLVCDLGVCQFKAGVKHGVARVRLPASGQTHLRVVGSFRHRISSSFKQIELAASEDCYEELLVHALGVRATTNTLPN